jgi:uncharacterized lipoprotein YajG
MRSTGLALARRRGFVWLVAASGLAALMLAGCGGTTKTPAVSTPKQTAPAIAACISSKGMLNKTQPTEVIGITAQEVDVGRDPEGRLSGNSPVSVDVFSSDAEASRYSDSIQSEEQMGLAGQSKGNVVIVYNTVRRFHGVLRAQISPANLAKVRACAFAGLAS